MDVGLVCDSCSTFHPIGVTECSRCGTALSLDGPRPATRGGPAASDASSAAADAGPGPDIEQPFAESRSQPNPLPGAAGAGPAPMQVPDIPTSALPSRSSTSRVVKKTQAFGVMQEARAKLVLIRGDGLDGVSFTLAGDEHLVGRSEAAMILFEDDALLSPVHANFFYRFGVLMVRDEDSENGVFIRIKGTVPVDYGDRFLVGEQMLEVQRTPESTVPEPTEDGTYFFGSPRRPAYFRVVQRLRGGREGIAYRADSPELGIGREGNDIDFTDDPFISGRHARLSWKSKQLSLTDLDSKNGTFLRIGSEHALQHGDYVFMGQQLLRVEIV
ncbi:FHA domain-containing protein [Haliangium ochraceum]|uniref:FHA domain containing protein n=1 Tax=Haliangium ochraceum (strain DSM 14365 / JCM 11303 / SMP-2) TaxID=502025 RepID=D0LR79_HALO1|nr:FHA domain-containing protein [Haliangium ochraceum]ACY17107.1 FHA domain containing protein [Haliangium ochraceum DSM 14365]